MKRRFFAILHAVGATRLAAWWNRRRVMVLCYHGVTERASRSPHDPDGLHIRADRFAAQIDYLRRHYRPVSLLEFLSARREGRRLPNRTVVLTFDDGYRNFLTVAAPILAERGLPASVFLITDRVAETSGDEPHWSEPDDERYLSWQEVKRLARDQGFEFGSHTRSHPHLPGLTVDESERELRESRDAIAACLGAGTIPFAYPYGGYTGELAERVRACGYTCGLTTDAGPNEFDADLFLIRRTLVGDGDDVPAFAARVSGLTWWLAVARGAMRGRTRGSRTAARRATNPAVSL